MDFEETLRILRAEQKRQGDRMREIHGAAERGNRTLTDAESAEFDSLEIEITARAERITQVEAQATRSHEAAAATRALGVGGTGSGGLARVMRESGPYRPDHTRSFFADLAYARMGNYDAVQRLHENARHAATYGGNGGLTRALSATDGAGGDFVPPLWAQDMFVELARPGRVTADLCTRAPLPEGTDSINIPRIVAGTSTDIQGTQNTQIAEQDAQSASIQSSVYTIAGGQKLSLQLIEQSPVPVDQIILGDLARDYALTLDEYIIRGTGVGQPMGVTVLAGTNQRVYDSVTPTFAELYSEMARLMQQVQTTRFEPATHWVMHPRRWAWFTTQLDNAGRPMVLPTDQGESHNAMGVAMPGAPAAGVVGKVHGLPVVTDPNIPTNLGAGTNQDVMILAKWDDLYLWEGSVRAQAFEQTYANQLSLYVRLYNYVSFQPARQPKSVGVLGGTGLVNPFL